MRKKRGESTENSRISRSLPFRFGVGLDSGFGGWLRFATTFLSVGLVKRVSQVLGGLTGNSGFSSCSSRGLIDEAFPWGFKRVDSKFSIPPF